jgi:hypothetical protein
MKRSISSRLAVAAVLIALPSCKTAQSDFPSDKPICLQKAGVVISGFSSRDARDAEKLGDNHALFILNPRLATFKQILSYGRHLSISWNRGETYLAIVDSEGSNREVLYVYDIQKGLLSRVATPAPSELAVYDHYSISVDRWNGDGSISLKISCYGDHNFDERTVIKP